MGPRRGGKPREWICSKEELLSAAWSPDGKRLAIGGSDNDRKLHIWDVVSGKPDKVLDPNGGLPALTFSPDGQFVVSGSTHHAYLRDWNLATGSVDQLKTEMVLGISDLAFSPDGRYLLTAHGDNRARLWDYSKKEHQKTFGGHEHWVLAVAWHPDGRTVATAGNDALVRLWSLTRDDEPRKLPTGYTHALAFSPDGRFLATAFSNKLVLWDVATGTKTASWQLPGAMTKVRFAADGRHLAIANANGTVYILRLSGIESNEPDRKAAEWVLATGSYIGVVADGKPVPAKTVDDLPKTPFELRSINVNRNPKVSDATLTVLKGLRHLTLLQISNSSASDVALTYFKDCKNPDQLIMHATRVTDAGLVHLEGFTQLHYLNLKQTAVTEPALRKLAAALPQCRIEWSGGVIEPR